MSPRRRPAEEGKRDTGELDRGEKIEEADDDYDSDEQDNNFSDENYSFGEEEDEDEDEESVYEESLDEEDASEEDEGEEDESEEDESEEEYPSSNEVEEEELENDGDIFFDKNVIASRPSSTLPAEDEATANAIIASLQNIMPELREKTSAPSPEHPLSVPSSARLTTSGPSAVRMTDLGYKISQLVLRRQPPLEDDKLAESTELMPDHSILAGPMRGMEEERGGMERHSRKYRYEGASEEEEQDVFLEKALSGRRRNRTGVRGRPKKIDYGFGKSTTQDLPPEVARLMGQANMAYVSRQYEQATHLLLEVIRRAPHAVEAYQTLALIHEELGDRERALSYYTIAAHLVRTDADLWRKLTSLTLALGRRDEAIYYLGRLLRMRQSSARAEYYWTRARLLVEREEYKRAILGFDRLLIVDMMAFEGEGPVGYGRWQSHQRGRPSVEARQEEYVPVEGELSIFEQVALLADRLGVLDQGLREHWCQLVEENTRVQGRPPRLSFLFILLEEFLLAGRAYDLVIRLIDYLAIPLVTSGVGVNNVSSLPASWFSLSVEEQRELARTALLPELRLYHLMALVSLKRASETDIQWATRLDPAKYGGQLKELGRLLLRTLQPTTALTLLLPLMEVPTVGDVDLAVLIGECYKLVPEGEAMAISTFEALLEMEPERANVRASLADLYRQTGREEEAAALMEQLTDAQYSPSAAIIPGEEAATFVRRPTGSIDEIFKGLFEWDPAILVTTVLEESTIPSTKSPTDGSPLQTILSHRTRSRRTTPGYRARKRARRRTRKYTVYSETQMAAVQGDYRKIISLYEQLRSLASPIDPLLFPPSLHLEVAVPPTSLTQEASTIVRQFRHLATPLIEDLLSNSALRPSEGIKQLMRTNSLALLHGLSVEEWHRLVCRWLVVETAYGGFPERALRLVRILLARSVFAHQPISVGHILLRLIYLGIARRFRGRPEVLLSASRWWIRHWPALSLATSLLLRAAGEAWRQGGETAIGAPLLRFIQRMARKHRHQALASPQTSSARTLLNWLSLCLHQTTERWEGAIAAGEALLQALPTHGPTLLALAVALLHQSVKRTCRQTSSLQARAFNLLHHYLAGASPDEGNYNMGRACHMMGLLDLAAHYYRASLRVPQGRFTREAAYNLHLVFLLSGQWDMAKHYLSFIVI